MKFINFKINECIFFQELMHCVEGNTHIPKTYEVIFLILGKIVLNENNVLVFFQ